MMGAAGDKNCAVITCRIDARDSYGLGLYGISLSVVDDEQLLVFSSVLFRNEVIDETLRLPELVSMITAPRPEERPEELENLEAALNDYIYTSRMFQSEKNLADPKSLEHKITYFCTSVMSLNAITFLNIEMIPRRELGQIITSLKVEDDEMDEGKESSSAENELFEEGLSNVAVLCDPVLDPVNGVPVVSLGAGMMIYCNLRKDSVFYNLMDKVSPDFDGIVIGDITAVNVNEFGTATVVVKLSEGVTGAIKIASNAMVKLAAKPDAGKSAPNNFRVEIIFAVSGVILFLCLMAILLHYLA